MMAKTRTVVALLVAPMAAGVLSLLIAVMRGPRLGLPPLTIYNAGLVLLSSTLLAYPAVAMGLPIFYFFNRLRIYGWLAYGIAGASLGLAYYLMLGGYVDLLLTDRGIYDALWCAVSGAASGFLFRSMAPVRPGLN